MSLNVGDIVYGRYKDAYGFVTDKEKQHGKTKYLCVYWFDTQKVVELALRSLLCNSLIKVEYGKSI